MPSSQIGRRHTRRPEMLVRRGALVAFLLPLVFGLPHSRGQDSRPGPMAPPPGHDVRRLSNDAKPEAPPPVSPEEMIRRFSEKEDEFLVARARYGFRKTIRVQEFDDSGKVSGEYQLTTLPTVDSDGKLYEKIVDAPPSSLHFLRLEPEDVESLGHLPAFPLTTQMLSKYDLTYVGKEQVDEVNCYLFRVKPKAVERTRMYMEGLVWIDDQDLEVVKTYGKWVTELGDVHSPVLPFTLFDTYRENVEGKYWFPAYSRSDDALHLKAGRVRIRLVIKWTDYTPLATATPASAPAASAPAAPMPASQPPAKP